MPELAAQEWHKQYGIGRRLNRYIHFDTANELIAFKKLHGRKGETAREAILRTAREIARKRGLNVEYYPGGGGHADWIEFKKPVTPSSKIPGF